MSVISSRLWPVARAVAVFFGTVGCAGSDAEAPPAPTVVDTSDAPPLAPGPEPLACDPTLSRVGGVSTEIRGLVIRDGVLYVSDDHAGFRTFDLSDPAAPRAMAWMTDLVGLGRGLELDGHYAYMTAADAGLYIIDIADPSAPSVVGTLDLPGYTRHCHVQDGYAYLADDYAGFRIADVRDPAAPIALGGISDAIPSFRVAISGTTAYVASGPVGVRVIDVADPSAPVQIAVFDTPGHAWDVVLDGTTLYVADDTAGVRVLDVSSRLAPKEIGSVDTPGEARSLSLVGHTLYLADGSKDMPVRPPEPGGHHGESGDDGLRRVDVTDPRAPKLIDAATAGGYALTLTANDQMVVVGVNDVGITLFDAATLAEASRIVQLPGWAQDVALADGWAFVVTTVAFRTVDLADLQKPVERAAVPLPGIGQAIVYADGAAWIAASEAGLLQVTLNHPDAPEFGRLITTGGSALDVALHGAGLVVATDAGLRVVDDRATGAVRAMDGEPAVAVAVADGRAFAGGASGLRVVDLASGEPITKAGLSGIMDVAAAGDLVAASRGSDGVQLFSLTPAGLLPRGSLAPPSISDGLALSGDHLYLTTYDTNRKDSGVRVADISNRDAPAEIGLAQFRAPAARLTLSGTRAFVAATNFGLQIFDARCADR